MMPNYTDFFAMDYARCTTDHNSDAGDKLSPVQLCNNALYNN